MIERLRNTRKSKKGFTLVELVVVIVIIAILAAALVTSLIGYVSRARQTAAEVEAHNVYTAAQAYISEQVGIGKYSIPAGGSVMAMTGLDAQIEGLTGMADVNVSATAAKNTISELTVDTTSGSITAMTYTAGNGYTCAYAVATGWTFTAPTAT